MNENRDEIRWSPRVSQAKLRRLYESTCRATWDGELIEEVGMTLYMRCRDIVRIHQAQTERKVVCPRCERGGVNTDIVRAGDGETAMTCGVCGWSMTWREYHRTFQRRQLNPGGAVGYFKAFLQAYEVASDARQKMLAIDRVIHEFHYSIRELPEQPTRSAGVNLIEGKLGEVVLFLNELSGLALPEDMRQTFRAWQEKHASIRWEEILQRKAEEKRRGEWP